MVIVREWWGCRALKVYPHAKEKAAELHEIGVTKRNNGKCGIYVEKRF